MQLAEVYGARDISVNNKHFRVYERAVGKEKF